MKKAVLAGVLLVGLALPAQEHRFWATANVSGTYFPPDFPVKTSVGGGLGLGGWLTDRVGLDVSGYLMPMKAEWTKSKEAQLQASLLYALNPGAAKWTYYLQGGPGITVIGSGLSGSHEREEIFTLHVGAGLMGRLAGNWFLKTDGKILRVYNQHGPRTEWVGLIGVGYTWGTQGRPKSGSK